MRCELLILTMIIARFRDDIHDLPRLKHKQVGHFQPGLQCPKEKKGKIPITVYSSASFFSCDEVALIPAYTPAMSPIAAINSDRSN